MHTVFSHKLQLNSFNLICNSYTSWSSWVISIKLCGIFHFWYHLIFIKPLIVVQSMVYLALKCHNSSQNKNDRKATHRFAPRPLIFKLQQEDWKFSDICMSWSSPKTDLEKNLMYPDVFWYCLNGMPKTVCPKKVIMWHWLFWGGAKRLPSLKFVTHPTMMKLGTVILYVRETQ